MAKGAVRGLVWGGLLAGLAMFGSMAVGAPATPSAASSTLVTIDLVRPFHTISPWRFVATQGPSVPDPIYSEGGNIPGVVRFCVQATGAGACDTRLAAMPAAAPSLSDLFDDAHALRDARIIYPSGPSGKPLLLLSAASMSSGDGDQVIFTQLLAYDRSRDRFEQIYAHRTGHNNNQDVRFIASGPLQGDVISVEPMSRLPYGYWITVNRLTPDYAYRPVLHYRSATIYNDGNPLAVVDSEMPNIEQRLGLWRPGQPLPVPAAGAHPCAKPHLVRMELWCS